MDTNSSLVIRVRQTTQGAPGVAVVIWSVVMAACIFGVRADIARSFFEITAVVATFLTAAYLGWHKRMGVVFVAPLISWLFAWFPLIVAEMIRDGFFKGLFVGLFLATIGWIIIGGAEFIALFLMAAPFRLVAGLVHSDADVTIINPIKFNRSE